MQQTITKIDVINVANSINKKVTDTEINWILANYNDYENEDPESNWNLIVENMLYNLPKYKIILLTPEGIKTEIYNPNEKSVEDFEKEMVLKYKTFVMQSSTLIN